MRHFNIADDYATIPRRKNFKYLRAAYCIAIHSNTIIFRINLCALFRLCSPAAGNASADLPAIRFCRRYKLPRSSQHCFYPFSRFAKRRHIYLSRQYDGRAIRHCPSHRPGSRPSMASIYPGLISRFQASQQAQTSRWGRAMRVLR